MQEINGGRRESSSSSCVPPGFRFHPTDEELVGYYLRKKVASHKIDLDVITDIDLYRIEPWDLQEKCGMGYEEQKEWYFFSHKDKKYPTGTRTNRATVAGFWKATGRDKAVYDRTKVIGMRKTLVFYKGRAPHGHKTDWIMHEYRLHSQDINTPPQEEGWVVCRAFKKRMTGQSKTSIEAGWDPTYYYDESTNSLSHNLCKQEIEAPLDHNQHYAQSDPFVQLPQLESPSLPPMKNPSPISHTPKLLNDHNSEDDVCINRRSDDTKKVTDWRDLDKFVASQLSHGDGYNDDDQILNIHSDSDLGLLLLQSGREEASAGPKLNELSTSDCDIGICIFNK